MRDLDLNDLRVFVRVVDRGGFAVAARELAVPTSTVSRAIARLEAGSGARLLHRSSRSVTPTSDGRALYADVGEAVASLERAGRAFEPATRQPKGVLRVTAASEIACTFLADVAVAFGERYPLVRVEVVLTNRVVNLVDEGFDLAVRAASRLADSSLVARKVGELDHGLYASPRYLERHGSPSTPAALAGHRCIAFRAKDFEKTWRLESGAETADVVVRSPTSADDFGYVRAAALAGGGIALMPQLVCAKDEAARRLVRVLPRFRARGATLYLLHSSANHVPARVAAFRDAVIEAFARAMRPSISH